MLKPLFRFTVGNCLQQGLDVLAESIRITTNTLGIENWDWAICYNGLSKSDVDFIQNVIGNRPIDLIDQKWSDCPIEDNIQSPRRKDGSYEWNGIRCGGTLWKVCPARMRLDAHEIIMDNDIILLRKFHQIDEWLQSNKALILEEPIRFYGRYNHLFPRNDSVFLNSGFMGLPPKYDFGAEIRKVWQENGELKNLSQADEQALLTYTLSLQQSIRIQKDQMVEVLASDWKTEITGEEQGLHFTQSNRIPNHRSWKKYLKLRTTQNEGII